MAETPPPFNPQPQYGQKKSTNPIIWILVALGGFCLVCVISSGVALISGVKELSNVGQCPINMGVANSAIKEYVAEKGMFPKAETWQDDIKPYYEAKYAKFSAELKDAGPMKDFLGVTEPGKPLPCSKGSVVTGIHFNQNLSGKKTSEFKEIGKEITLFEGEGIVYNAHGVPFEGEQNSSETAFGKPRPKWKMSYDDDIESTEGEVKFKTN